MRADKTVRWSTVTVYEFGVALGGSAVPRRGGPSIGLARTASSVWSAPLDALTERALQQRAAPSKKRKREAAAAAAAASENEEKPKRVKKPAASKRSRVRWLKPLERVTMLERAGCSEQQIYRMMMESSDIAMSRRLCLSVQRHALAAKA